MRKSYLKKSLAVLLSAMMLPSLVACGNGSDDKASDSVENKSEETSKESSEAPSESKTEESSESSTDAENPGGVDNKIGWATDYGDTPWTGEISNLSYFAPFAGDMTDECPWVEDVFLEYAGVKFDRIANSTDQVEQTVMASQDLPDIIGFETVDAAVAAAESGLLLCLDDYKDQLPNIYDNPIMESALNYWRDHRSGSAGALYVVPTMVGENYDATEMPMTRIDLWEKLGEPQIKNIEDYFQMLMDMKDSGVEADEIVNKDDEGNDVPTGIRGDVYSILGWGKDAKDPLGMFNWPNYYGWWRVDGSYAVYAKGDGSQIATIFEDGELKDIVKAALKGYMTLNQGGYISPDTISTDWTTARPRLIRGEGLFAPVKWMGESYTARHADGDTGMYPIVADDMDIYLSANSPIGTGYSLAIAANCEDIEGALRFLNWFYSPFAEMIIYNGPEGYMWEYDENGNAVLCEDWSERLDAAGDAGLGSGGGLSIGRQFINTAPYTMMTKDPKSGQTLYHQYWQGMYDIEQAWGVLEWRKINNCTTVADFVENRGGVPKSDAFSYTVGITDNNLTMMSSSVNDAWTVASAKMVEAKSDEEFEALWEEFEKDCNDYGLDQVATFIKEDFAGALDIASDYPLHLE
nr:extracellular solute-binding protein [uncultured Acetatifactor sp.]